MPGSPLSLDKDFVYPGQCETDSALPARPLRSAKGEMGQGEMGRIASATGCGSACKL